MRYSDKTNVINSGLPVECAQCGVLLPFGILMLYSSSSFCLSDSEPPSVEVLRFMCYYLKDLSLATSHCSFGQTIIC